jgi:hypothetical protein
MADYDEVKPQLFVDLVSADQNREKLQDVPHKSFEDMAMVYRVMIDSKDRGKCTDYKRSSAGVRRNMECSTRMLSRIQGKHDRLF